MNFLHEYHSRTIHNKKTWFVNHVKNNKHLVAPETRSIHISRTGNMSKICITSCGNLSFFAAVITIYFMCYDFYRHKYIK